MQISQTGQVPSQTACQGIKEPTSMDTLSVFGALGWKDFFLKNGFTTLNTLSGL